MRLPHDWLRRHPMLAPTALALLGAVLFFVLRTRERITRQNFGKIRVGMSQADLRLLLGAPDCQVGEVGLVNGPGSYSTNSFISAEEKERRGFREYEFQQWTTSQLTIVVISDLQGQVVCRYTGPGQKQDWIATLRAWLPQWL